MPDVCGNQHNQARTERTLAVQHHLLSTRRLIRRGLTHHWRLNLAVALGVAAATAVLTGALLVGDSVRGSLRHLALDRLGRIEGALVGERFFRVELGPELFHGAAKNNPGGMLYAAIVPGMLVPGTVDHADHSTRASGVTLLAVADPTFTSLGDGGPAKMLSAGEVVLNEPLAAQLNAAVGDEVIVRIGAALDIPADSPWGRRTETLRSRRLRVTEIIPAAGLGHFSLEPNQADSLNAFVTLETLQQALERPGRANALFVSRVEPERVESLSRPGGIWQQIGDLTRGWYNNLPGPAEPPTVAHLNQLLLPRLDDLNLTLAATDRGYVQLTTDRMLLEPAIADAALSRWAEHQPQPVLTYLANTIAGGTGEIPYSTVTALDPVSYSPLGPLKTLDGEVIESLAADEIVLNQWAADDLNVQPGDEITLTYFEPESVYGELAERTTTFRLRGIVPLEGVAADSALTPEVRGVTDQESISDWDPPFPFSAARIRDKDETYWDDHRGTPKAFVSLARGQELWGSRFGDVTSIRVAPPAGQDPEQFAAQLSWELLEQQGAASPRLKEAVDFKLMPIRELALQAASGTTPFNMLFLGFSMFIIAAAIMLVALLFRLGVEQRASELGLLGAVGWPRQRIARVLAGEGVRVAACGAALGLLIGVGYAWLMIRGLTTWWVEAIRTPFLQLYVTPTSFLIGYLVSLLICSLTIFITVRRLSRLPLGRLLAGRTTDDTARLRRQTPWARRTGYVCLLAAIAVALLAFRLEAAEAQAGAFFGSGALVLSGCLLLLWSRLVTGETASILSGSLWRLALRNAARNPGRSTLTIGLVAAASFLIIAISAFRLDPTPDHTRRDTGTGGYALIGQTTTPIYQDLGTEDGRFDFGFTTAEERLMEQTQVFAFRSQDGEDASCLNLYQTRQPRVLGVGEDFIARGGFTWAATAAADPATAENPWLLLNQPTTVDTQGRTVFPVVIDQATAMYSLHLYGGIGSEFEITDGRGCPAVARVVGLLRNSVLQGELVTGPAAFRQLFPDISGSEFFLVEVAPEIVPEVQLAMQRAVADWGLVLEPTSTRLARFLAVQNTYLSTFQSLGGLGLLLGTFGLATVQLRNVFERRGELALLRATGFRRGRLAWMVLLENGVLLVGGVGLGTLAAGVAVAPHLLGAAAGLPLVSLAATLVAVLVIGLLAGLVAVRATLRAPLLAALRGN